MNDASRSVAPNAVSNGVALARCLEFSAREKGVEASSEEFYDALRARQPNQRQRNLINMWWQEATNDELIRARAEDVYSIRELVAAIHAAGAQDDYPERNADVNGFADH